MIEVNGFQFSFHNVPLNEPLENFQEVRTTEKLNGQEKASANSTIVTKIFTWN